MNIIEAARWSKNNDKPVCRKVDLIPVIFDNDGPAHVSASHENYLLLYEDFLATDWQPWEEPLEYMSFEKAQDYMHIAKNLQHSKFPNKKRIWSGSSIDTIWDMPFQESGEVFKVKSIPVEYLTPEWYVVTD